MKPSLSIVIPVYNEEDNIEDSIATVVHAMGDRFSSGEILVVNDGSTDNSAAVAERCAAANPNVRVLHNNRNRGMGHSLAHGFSRAAKEYVGSFPGDNGLDGDSFAQMFDLLGQADIVLYYIANPEFRSWPRRFLSWTFVKILNLLFGLRIRYYNGHAIYRRELVQNVVHTAVGHMFLAEVLIRLVKSGHSYVEIGTIQRERKHGQTKAFSIRNITSVFTGILKLAWQLNVRQPR